MGNFLLESGNWLLWVAPFLPLVVGLLVKSIASKSTKTVVMLVINGLAALAYQIDTGDGILTKAMAGAWLYGIIVSVATHYGVWRNLGSEDSNLSNIAPESGIG